MGDGVAVEEDGHVLAIDQLGDEVGVDVGLGFGNKALPGALVGVGDVHLVVGHGLTLAPVDVDVLALIIGGDVDLGMGGEIVILGAGDDGDGRVLGDLDLTVLDDVVLPFLIGHGAVVVGDRGHALDGVEQGSHVSLVQEHDGLVFHGVARENGLHQVVQLAQLSLGIHVCLLLCGDLFGGGLLGGGLGGFLGRCFGGCLGGGDGYLGSGLLGGFGGSAGGEGHRHGPCQKQGTEEDQNAFDIHGFHLL